MIIRNFTPHPINLIVSFGDDEIVITYESVGVARVKSDKKTVNTISVAVDAINGPTGFVPLVEQTFGEVQDLPDPEMDVLLIVSRMVKSAIPDRQDCVCPENLVRDSDGNIVGCRALSL